MSEDEQRRERYAVEVFGITLEVSNPRLAEILAMDARSDVRDLFTANSRTIAEALPDVVVALPTPHSEALARARQEFRKRADELGAGLGFKVESDGTWASPIGIEIVSRTVERPLTVAAAAHYVSEVAAVTDRLPDTTSVLFVVDGQQSADVFKVAIRQRRLHNLMRTVSLPSLEELSELLAAGRLTHKGILVLLAPIADIDAGEIMSVFRADEAASAAREEETAE